MADRIITVTDPSIVTNDTLIGYNNYTDQPSPDTSLGEMMTPTEAANGHTVVLTDGLVHQVTSKPVGAEGTEPNGEFTGVVSNAVTVDLTSATWIPATMTLNNYSKDVLNYVCDASSGTANGGHSTTAVLVGDFDVRAELITNATNPEGYQTNKTVIGFRSDADFSIISNAWSAYNNSSSLDLRADGAVATADSPQGGIAMKDGLYLVLRRRADTVTWVVDDNGVETLVNTLTGQSTAPMYVYLQNGEVGKSVYNPEYLLS